MSNIDEQFLPLDSGIKSGSSPDHSISTGYRTDSLFASDSELCFLTSKISELQKNYLEMEKKYLNKIKLLKQELLEKHLVQSTLNHQLSNLNQEYDQHKSQIQKISAEIKKSLEENSEKQQKEQKLKSASPKNHTNHSPKRFIKKSLEMAKMQIIQPKKEFLTKGVSSSQNIDMSGNTERSDKKMTGSAELPHDSKKYLTLDEDSFKSSHQISSNQTDQLKKGRKLVYSPTNQTNGPSPKKKLLFNSSKQLDLFSKPVTKKQSHAAVNGSPQRRINISPTHKKKQNVLNDSNKVALQKQIKKELAVIEEKPTRLEVRQNEAKKVGNTGPSKPSSPAHRKKTSSPESALGFLRKKISNKNLMISTEFPEPLKESKQLRPEAKQPGKQLRKEPMQRKPQQKIEVQKKTTKSPTQSSKYIKATQEATNFSPGRKLIRNSPTQKKTDSAVVLSQKPKLFTNMREKLDDNIFK